MDLIKANISANARGKKPYIEMDFKMMKTVFTNGEGFVSHILLISEQLRLCRFFYRKF